LTDPWDEPLAYGETDLIVVDNGGYNPERDEYLMELGSEFHQPD
jgi:hypothetical protein